MGFSDHLRVLQKRKDRLQQETEALAEEAAHIRQRTQQAEEVVLPPRSPAARRAVCAYAGLPTGGGQADLS